MNSQPMSVVRMTATVHGRVQGVGYRYWTHHTAHGLPLVGGTVRNLSDGGVEVKAEATSKEPLNQLLTELRHGPTTAHVEDVDVIFEDAVPATTEGFHVV